MNVQERVDVGEKRKRPAGGNGQKGGSSLPLPKWFEQSGNYLCNTTMPCLDVVRNSLREHLQSKDVQVGWVRGVFCPVHLIQGKKHVHHSNGVYIGVQVISIVLYI